MPTDFITRGTLILVNGHEVDVWNSISQAKHLLYPLGTQGNQYNEYPQISLDGQYLAELSNTRTSRGTIHTILNLWSGINQNQVISKWQDLWGNLMWMGGDHIFIDSYSRQDADPLGTFIYYDPLSGQYQKIIPTMKDINPGDGSILYASPIVIYSSDPSRMVYFSTNYEFVLWDNTHRKSLWSLRLPGFGFIFRWSPDGSQAIYRKSSEELHLLTRDGQDRQLTYLDSVYNTSLIYIGYYLGPSWSPDSRHLAFFYKPGHDSEGPAPDNQHLAIVDTQTGITTDLCLPGDGYGNITWSPDGRQLIIGERSEYTLVDLGSGTAYLIHFDNDFNVGGWVDWK
jgi:hypothetical protein